jgi:hypothetical protein
LIQVALSFLYIGGVAFVFWVLLREGRGFRFRPVGLILAITMICLLPAVITRAALSVLGSESPAAVRWLTPAEGLLVALSIMLLIVRPDLMGYRPRRRASRK